MAKKKSDVVVVSGDPFRVNNIKMQMHEIECPDTEPFKVLTIEKRNGETDIEIITRPGDVQK